ncbi:hypothetical protein Gohar_027330, partial [Gossypium harknessii]|nr:hypothetical protein [Gossypium harknessii]
MFITTLPFVTYENLSEAQGSQKYYLMLIIYEELKGELANSDVGTIGEPLNLDPSEYTYYHNSSKSSKLSSKGNWLQCQEFVEGKGGSKGTICGKWR